VTSEVRHAMRYVEIPHRTLQHTGPCCEETTTLDETRKRKLEDCDYVKYADYKYTEYWNINYNVTIYANSMVLMLRHTLSS